MIMMRPNNVSPQKISKPPPPVPPRPNKSLVQEALAKTRHNLELANSNSKPPNRAAPPPPPPVSRRPLAEVKAPTVKKQAPQPQQPPPVYERSISLDKVSSRPVVYQSDNVKKTAPINVSILKKVDSFKNEIVKKTNSLKRTNSKQLEKPQCVPVVIKNGENVKKDEKIEGCGVENLQKEKPEEPKSQNSTLDKSTISSGSDSSCSSSNTNSLDNKKWDKMLNDRNHVNTLIDEMFASVLDVNKNPNVPPKNDNKIIISNKIDDSTSGENLSTVIVISSSDDGSDTKSNASTGERKVKFNDRMNHELLIDELQNMKNVQEKYTKRQRLPSIEFVKTNEENIHTNDWFGVSEEGKEVKMSSCHITIEDARSKVDCRYDDGAGLDFDRISKMSHLHGLPPLPKSLSGFNFMDHHHQSPPTPVRTSSMRSGQGGPQITPTHHGNPQSLAMYPKINGDGLTTNKKTTNLDTQLAILRREMYSLRQQDLSLLSQLWSLNESIQDFRQMLQDQDDRIFSPPSPSPTPSSADEEEFYMSATSVGFRSMSAVPGRKMSGSSGASGSVG